MILITAANFLIRAIYSTVRMDRQIAVSHEELRKKYGNIIYAFWHGQLLSLIYSYRGLKISIMTSTSKDGDLVTELNESFGFKCARGSSTRNGMRGLIELKRTVEEGYSPSFAVDGPKGPAFQVKPGIIYFAKKLQLPIIPVAVSVHPCFRFSSWDRFIVPYPFAKVVLRLGRPVFVNKDSEPEQKAMELKSELDLASSLAAQSVSS